MVAKTKIISAVILFAAAAADAAALYHRAQEGFEYEGIPAVACYDQTKPLAQNFKITLHITIDGKNYPLDPRIGHDRGNCLRSIYTDDSSGAVMVRSNYAQPYTLGQFFNVWHKMFSAREVLGRQVGDGQYLDVFVNGVKVNTYENTPLTLGADIAIYYGDR